MKTLISLLLIMNFTACNGKKGSSSSPKKDNNCVTDSNGGVTCTYSDMNDVDETVLDDTEGLEYFEQFLFSKEDISDDPDFPEFQYRYLMSGLHKDFLNDSGERKGAKLSIGLFKDGSFRAVYDEIKYNDNGGFFPAGCKELSGEWDVDNSKLILTSNGVVLFSGAKHFQDNQHMIMINLKESILSSEALGLNFDSSLGYTNSEYPEDQLLKCFNFPF
jgi:hypothetical protein